MCSMQLVVVFVFLIYSVSAAKKSAGAAAIRMDRGGSTSISGGSDINVANEKSDETINGINGERDDKGQGQGQGAGGGSSGSYYPAVYPTTYGSIGSSLSPSSAFYPQYNFDSVYYNYKYPQRSLESTYYAPRQGKYPSPVDHLDVAAAGSSNHPDYVSLETPLMDNVYMASSHGGGHGHSSHGHGGHGHGWGWGKEHKHRKTVTNYKVSAVNTDAIGLLGLLGLLSILQAVLLSLTTTTATGRKRRDASGAEIDTDQEIVNHISKLVLPSFNIIAYAHIKKIPVSCTHHEICRANNILVNNVGGAGIDAAEKITDAISAMLGKSNAQLSKEIDLAGKLGRNGSNQCQDVYPICKELEKDGVYTLPVLLKKTHPLYYNHMTELVKVKH